MLSPRTAIIGMLIFGTLNSTIGKVFYMLDGFGLSDDTHPAHHAFVKPWMLVLNMFIGMTACIPLTRSAWPDRKTILQLGLPSAFDLLATILMNTGLIWVNATIYQMMRAAEMIFAALFGVLFLKRALVREHYVALCMCILGVVLVGGASMLGGEGQGAGTPTQQLFGMFLIISAQAVQAAQLTCEDFFMHEIGVDDMLLVGMEGLWGVALTVILMIVMQSFPGSDVGGVVENTADSIQLLLSNPALLLLFAVQAVSAFSYNYSGMSVTGNFSALFRTILETMRTLGVWVVDLLLFYCHIAGLGEKWTPYSYLQALGFFVLVSATLVYAKGDAREKRTCSPSPALAAHLVRAADSPSISGIPARDMHLGAMSPTLKKLNFTLSAHSPAGAWTGVSATEVTNSMQNLEGRA